MKGWRLFLAGCLLVAAGAAASGYALLGAKWASSPVAMHLELGAASGLSDGAASWDDAAATALTLWNFYLQRLQFTPVIDSLTPADADGINNVFFSSTIYGDSFSGAVAVTTEWDAPGRPGVRSEGDVIFNSNLDWDSYRGPLRPAAGNRTIYDIRRVALHEFGHVVGLDHPDDHGQRVVAIMNAHVSDIDSLQRDDIRGGQFLYGARAGTYAPARGVFNDPTGKKFTTRSRKQRVFGTSDTVGGEQNFLSNSRIAHGKRLFRTAGFDPWKCIVPLKMGRNTITIDILGSDGVLRKGPRIIVTRKPVH